VDLKDKADRDVFYALVAQSDVYIQNFGGRGGAHRRDFETLSGINPKWSTARSAASGGRPYAQRRSTIRWARP